MIYAAKGRYKLTKQLIKTPSIKQVILFLFVICGEVKPSWNGNIFNLGFL